MTTTKYEGPQRSTNDLNEVQMKSYEITNLNPDHKVIYS